MSDNLPATAKTTAVTRPLTHEQLAALELTDLERQAVLDTIRGDPTIGTVAAMRQAGLDRPKRELKALAALIDDDEIREARGWNLRKVEQTMWGIATNDEHQSCFRAGQFLMRAYGDPRFREHVELEHKGAVDVTVEHVRRYTLADLLVAAGSLAGLSTSTSGELPAPRPLLAELVRGEPAAGAVPVRPGP